MSDNSKDKKDSSASKQDTGKTESQQKEPVNHGRTFSGTGVEKKG